jgi:signal recognition particle subunit SEC65
VQSPRIAEIEEAAQRLGLEHELVLEKGYSRTPWFRGGMLLVRKKESKEQLVKKIARQLLRVRSEPLKVK